MMNNLLIRLTEDFPGHNFSSKRTVDQDTLTLNEKIFIDNEEIVGKWQTLNEVDKTVNAKSAKEALYTILKNSILEYLELKKSGEI